MLKNTLVLGFSSGPGLSQSVPYHAKGLGGAAPKPQTSKNCPR